MTWGGVENGGGEDAPANSLGLLARAQHETGCDGPFADLSVIHIIEGCSLEDLTFGPLDPDSGQHPRCVSLGVHPQASMIGVHPGGWRMAMNDDLVELDLARQE